jgi:pSer/pThr/pTyr-binding forkhead associated (FHA) protein
MLDVAAAALVQEEAYTPFSARKKTGYHYGYVEKLVLKFTTYSQNNQESAFVIGKAGGTIGRDSSNTVSVPSDMTLQKECHAVIGHKAGSFYLKNQGSTHCAAIRIGTEPGLRDWPLGLGATFSAGNSIFVVKELVGGELIVEVIDGPLEGERRKVGQKGATLGRSPDNTLSIADPELSRRHSRIEYDDKDGKVIDIYVIVARVDDERKKGEDAFSIISP